MAAFWRFRFLLSLIFATAFCSYAYELVLAQILSILWGDVVLQYTVTTGVYIAAMGTGALFTPLRISAERSFIWIEVGLSCLAMTAPFFLIGADIEHRAYAGFISYLFIILIGFLSGMELPLLMRILNELRVGEAKHEKALFTDYIGMFFAGFLFAIFLNRIWGTLQTSLWLALANLGLALICGIVWGFDQKKIRRVEVPLIFVAFSAMSWFVSNYLNQYQEQLEKWVIGN
jgi:spermidine synthase